MKKPTLKDIAKECGCSVTSAARALRDSRTISQALRERVHQTAERLGYIPNASAQSIRSGRSHTIGVILQDLRNPYFAVVAKYIEDYARSKGYFSLIITTEAENFGETEACRTALGKNVDGIILFPIQQDDHALRFLKKNEIPVVLGSRRFADIDCDSVVGDDFDGMYQVTRCLIASGAEHIIFLNGASYIYSAGEREKGFWKAIEEAGVQGQIYETEMRYGKTEEMLTTLQYEAFDAVITFCDVMGYEAYRALRRMGRKVPEEIKLASNDGIYRDLIMPIDLTTAELDRKKLAKEVVDLLIDRIENKTMLRERFRHIVLPETLYIGETS